MAYLILKQFNPLSIHVWVEKLRNYHTTFLIDLWLIEGPINKATIH